MGCATVARPVETVWREQCRSCAVYRRYPSVDRWYGRDVILGGNQGMDGQVFGIVRRWEATGSG